MFDVKKAAEGVFAEAVEIRRDIHMHPEIGNDEKRTSGIVAEQLRSWGIEVQENVRGYGVVGLLKGAKPGKCIAFRADMDALPVQEETDCEYKSQNPGLMHACGHDCHVATLLSAAKILSGLKSELSGTVKFIFQPAEEQGPEGGSKGMIEAGVLENPKVDTIIALHVFSDVPSGKITVCEGPASAAADIFIVDVIGKGGHGAQPHTAKDATLAACELVCMLQSVVSRWTDPNEMAVLTIGAINSGVAANIINGTAKVTGSVRSLSDGTRKTLEEGVRTVTDGVAKATRTEMALDYIYGYDAVYNTADAVELISKSADEYLGDGVVEVTKMPLSGSEDFSYFVKACGSGALAILGGKIEGAPYYANHNSRFNWDENAMKVGIGAFVSMALKYLA